MTTFEAKHGRPKPPRISNQPSMEGSWYRYVLRHSYGNRRVLRVHRTGGEIAPGFPHFKWKVSDWYGGTYHLTNSHAEAIAYAHKIANERGTR